MMDTNQSRAMYLTWLRKNQPQVYKAAMRSALDTSASKSLSGLGESASWSDAWNNLITGVTKVLTTAQGTKSAIALTQTNTQRVQMGLPPLNANGMPMTTAEMNAAGYPASTVAMIEQNLATHGTTGFFGIPLWAILAGVGLGGYLLLKR